MNYSILVLKVVTRLFIINKCVFFNPQRANTLLIYVFIIFKLYYRSGGNDAITFETSTNDSLTTLAMKSSNHSDLGKDYRGGSSSTIGQEDSIPVFLRRLNDLNIRVGTRTRFLIELDDSTGVQVRV